MFWEMSMTLNPTDVFPKDFVSRRNPGLHIYLNEELLCLNQIRRLRLLGR
jgi:hypothetical protein